MRLFPLASRNLLRHKILSSRNILSVAISALILTLLFGVIGGMESDLKKSIVKYVSGEIRIQNKKYQEYEIYNPSYYLIENSNQIIDALSELDDIEAMSQKLMFSVSILKDKLFEAMQVVGLDFSLEERYNGLSQFLVEGRMPQQEREILVGKSTSEDFNIRLGDGITFMGSTALRGQNGMTVKVAGIVDYPVKSLNERKLILALSTAQDFFKSPHAVTEIGIQKAKGSHISLDELKDKVETIVNPLAGNVSLSIEKWTEVSDLYNMFIIARITYFIIGMIFCLLGSLVVYNTMYISLYSRRYELGVLEAIGFHRRMIRRIFFWEVGIIVTIGACLGVILGLLCTYILQSLGIDFEKMGSSAEGTMLTGVLYPEISLLWSFIVFVYVSVISFVISVLPVRILKKEGVLSLLRSDV